MGDVLEAKAKLRELAEELDKRSREQAQTNRELEPVLEQYEDFLEEFETDLHGKCEDDGKRLPSEKMRVSLARQAMPEEFRKKHDFLQRKERRLEKRIGVLKPLVDAWRSVVSADKAELEAIS